MPQNAGSMAMRYPVGKALRHVELTVHVTGISKMRVRLWLGRLVILLAVWVMGVGKASVKVDED